MKHNSKLEARMFEDGTNPAISLNPVLSVWFHFLFVRVGKKKMKLADNVQGLLHVAAFENMMLETKLKLKNKTWNMEQKLNSNLSAWAAADSDIQPIVIPSADIAVNPMLAVRGGY